MKPTHDSRLTTLNSQLDPAFRLETFDYPLDKRLIAQFSLSQRDQARLLMLHRADRRREHRLFQDMIQYFHVGDLLVLNDTRVIPARLIARKIPTRGQVEVLLLRASSGRPFIGGATIPPPLAKPDGASPFPTLASARCSTQWEVLIKGSVAIGQRLQAARELEMRVLERFSDGRWLVDLVYDGELFDVLDRVGLPPLPPYIRRKAQESDREQYQTIYANPSAVLGGSGGSVAAPTAGLHFTEALLGKIRAEGVRQAFITLHIGPGTFRPVRSSDIRLHSLDPEYYEISPETARLIEETRAGQGRIIAVGTSTTRTLEAAMAGGGKLNSSGMTDLFIYPGYRFQAVSGLITNFHLPKSTLFILASAFAGIEALREAYAEAIRMRYRFLSFGDAMLIL